VNKVRKAIHDYLALRRSLGFKLVAHEIALREFAAFLEGKNRTRITTALALEWATQHSQQPAYKWASRLSIVRGFAQHWSATDPTTEVPPPNLLPYRPTRARPYFYSDEEILKLLQAAKSLPSRHPLRPWTYHCFFGLLAVTGLRLGEALHLRIRDIDWSEGMLTVRNTKFGKTRLVPLHPSTCKILAAYAKHRDRFFALGAEAYFFVNKNKNHLHKGDVHRIFYALSRKIGLRSPSASRGPRLHDFRHRFAVETMLRWYRKGEDPKRHLPTLSTYLGHGHVTDTYWYLTSTPELLAAAGERLEKRWEVQNARQR
jgi:integrase